MKALIVDDEKHVRDAVQMLVDWNSFGITDVFTAPEGESAISIIQAKQPEIIFTDMQMPVMNGSELLEWIQQHCPHSKTIVISGHDDFGYMRHTIKYGGMDYILKPIDEEQLHEALQKAVDAVISERKLRDEDRNQNMKLNQIKPVYWDKIFSSLLADPTIYRSMSNEIEREFYLPPQLKTVRIAVLALDSMQQQFVDRFASNLDLLTFSIANIANEFVAGRQCGYAFRNWNAANELVILSWKDLNNLPELLHSVNQGIYRTYNVRFHFGVGNVASFPESLQQSYKEAKTALNERNLLSSESWIHKFNDLTVSAMQSLPFHHYQEDIRIALMSNNHKQITAAVSKWFEELQGYKQITKEQFQLWAHEFAIFQTRLLSGVGNRTEMEPIAAGTEAIDSFLIPIDERGKLSIAIWQEEFIEQLTRLAAALSRQTTTPTIIDEIAAYIETHYQEELSLQDIADRFALSREYISRKFKQEKNENLSDFIGRIRIEKAKILLINPHLRIVQIAEMIGYNDEKYFSKVFKKLTGCAPNDFRKAQQP